MGNSYAVTVKALEDDAKTFEKWSGELAAMKTAIPVNLQPLDFSILPGAQDIYTAYMKAAGVLQNYIQGGADRFDGFARTLLKTETVYLNAEDASSSQIASVATELASL